MRTTIYNNFMSRVLESKTYKLGSITMYVFSPPNYKLEAIKD